MCVTLHGWSQASVALRRTVNTGTGRPASAPPKRSIRVRAQPFLPHHASESILTGTLLVAAGAGADSAAAAALPSPPEPLDPERASTRCQGANTLAGAATGKGRAAVAEPGAVGQGQPGAGRREPGLARRDTVAAREYHGCRHARHEYRCVIKYVHCSEQLQHHSSSGEAGHPPPLLLGRTLHRGQPKHPRRRARRGGGFDAGRRHRDSRRLLPADNVPVHASTSC